MSKESKSKQDIDVENYARAAGGLPSTTEVLPRLALQEGLHMYLNFVPLKVIETEIGVTSRQLRHLVYDEGGWKSQRDALHQDILESIKQKSLKRLRKASGVALRIVTNGLVAFEATLAREERDATLEEVEVLSNIHSQLHKAKITEEDPEAEKQRIGITPRQVLDALNGDPYIRKALAASAEQKQVSDLQDETSVNTNSDSLANPNG